jgi:glycosyltransferase involved in cell wall biosynthesis
MFLDSDDLLAPTALEKLCWAITVSPDSAFVYSGVVHFGDIEGTCFEEFDPIRLKKENYLAATCVLRRKVFLALGGNDISLTHSWEDYDFWLRLIERGYVGKLFREPLFFYRRHEAGKSQQIRRAAAVGQIDVSREIQERHLRRGNKPLEALHGTTYDPPAPAEPGLIDRFADCLREVDPMRQDRYRRANVPNLFCLRAWVDRRARILYLIPNFAVGGAEAFDLRILSCLTRESYRITLVACEEPDGPWYDEFKTKVDEIFSLERMGDSWESRMAFLRYLMISKSIDLVFNRNTTYGYELAAKWRTTSTEVRFVDLLHLHAFGEDWVRASASYHDRLDLRYVISSNLRDYAAKEYGIDKNRFQVLYYGLETQEISAESASAADRRAIRERWNIPASAPVVGFVGRVTEQKNPLKWLSVAARCAKKYPDAVFLVVGDGELMKHCIAEAAHLGLSERVIFTGYQRDAARYCAAMDALLLTSKYEGLPLVILEALAHGTPVISSGVGAVAECLTQDTGLIVPANAGDEEYAVAVSEMLELRRSKPELRARCHNLLASRFSKENMQLQLRLDFSRMVSTLDRERRLIDYQLDLMLRPILP